MTKVRIIKDINAKELTDRIRKNLGDNNRIVNVGIPLSAGNEDGTGIPLALVAAVNELGSGRVPERSFLRSAIRENKAVYSKINKVNLAKMVKGQMTCDQALSILGNVAVGHVKQKIRTGPFTPNADSTIKAKGSDRPLIDDAQMIQNIVFELGNKND